ncbi:uncharacterized protein BDV17DRAFT_282030 [Aspergillus undulatus]|uniref:uncharacterized protein n=1 Tax=Aspergillus undulatus TaxID=1810928 RepID=UPI003CCCF122
MSSSRKLTCDFPDCNASYRRKEHLNRHKRQHLPQQSFQCPNCDRTFGRNDTLRRHMRQNHQEVVPIPPTRQACINCRVSKSRCEGGQPCKGCLRRQISCSFSDNQTAPNRLSPYQDVKLTSSEKIQRFLKLYFEFFHPHWPFIHHPSFKINRSHETPLLVQSMVLIGMWVMKAPSTRSAAIDLHMTLRSAIHEQREKWDASIAEYASAHCSWPLAMYQAILLHIIFSLLYRGKTAIGLDLKPSIPASDTGLLASLVRSCRRLGMLHYPNILARYQPDGDLFGQLPYVWVGIEELKRFNLALYRVCRVLGFDKDGSNTNDWELDASELQFPMPKNERLWNAATREEWESAAAEDENGDQIEFGDIKESEWISRSAELLRLI